MKRFLKIFIALAVLVVFAAPSLAANYDYSATVYKRDASKRGGSDLTPITSGIMFQVLTINTDTAATITRFGDNAGTSVTNPVTATNFASTSVCGGKVRFRTSASSVDLIVVDAAGGGFTAFVEGFTPNDHSIVIDETPNVMHHGMIWFTYSDNTATDTGVDFLPDTIIHNVIVEVTTIDATETISVGTYDTATGFRSGVAVGVLGYIDDTAVITSGSNADYWTASTYGSLLATAITGADTNVTTLGGVTRLEHVVVTSGTDDDLYYTGSAGSDTAAGYIHYFFTRLR